MRRTKTLLIAAALPVVLAAQMERYVAIDNVCAWPNLTLLPGGAVLAHIFGKPSHGLEEGDMETWISEDQGRLWRLQGVPAPHDPGTTRIHVAAGLANDGSLIALTTGWGGAGLRGHVIEPWISRSTDGGKTWDRSGKLSAPAGIQHLIAFGNVVAMGGKRLAAPLYAGRRSAEENRTGKLRLYPTLNDSYLFFSEDDGRTWGDPVLIGADKYNETAVLRLRANRWLAAARAIGGTIDLFVSENEGRTWTFSMALTSPSHHPGHLLRLADGRILLTYGIRERLRLANATKPDYAIGVRFSKDEGRTWSAPARLVSLPTSTDGGYPATLQLPDGTLLTAYYSSGIPEHNRYHMGVVRWNSPD
ncbi:MAG: exo-alpha-sialidase [Bryobacterales bacterium]|nr:exo-alpha-sialidase [Bryobacterales bacterium]